LKTIDVVIVREAVVGPSLAYQPIEGSQNIVFRYLQSFATKITQDSSPKIIVTLLTLILKIGQDEYSILFCL